MTALAVLLVHVASSIGFGAMGLRGLGIDSGLDWLQRVAWSFVLGIGVLGWLLFFVGVSGYLSPAWLLATLLIGVPGLVFLGRPQGLPGQGMSHFERLLLAGLLLALSLDGLEGLSPPADADTLAYHFATPKLFLEQGRIFFIPRAVDGAAPLLLQMTYASALGLGGEKALTLWTMVSGWGTAFLLFVVARNHMSRAWALVITLLWLTTPAVLYGGGTGQVEVRNAGFVILAVAALMRGRETELVRYVALAGLAVGMFVANKYTGLFFAVACGGAILTFKRWPRRVLVFGALSLLAGFQWYLWNFIHTGDPVFPMLFPVIGGADYPFWDALHHQALQNDLFFGERGIPNTPPWMLAYPFLATFATSEAFDSGRAGFGPFLLLILPFALAGLWRFRRDVATGAWLLPVLVVFTFYVLWFLSGSSQRARHLVPLYPLALLLFGYLAERWAASAEAHWPLVLACAFSLGVQMAGHGAASYNFARHVFSDESRDQFLARNVTGYDAVMWINTHLAPTDRIMVVDRQLNYLISVPVYYTHKSNEVFVDIRGETANPEQHFHQLRAMEITHTLSTVYLQEDEKDVAMSHGTHQWRGLLALKCAEEVGRVDSRFIGSRSLGIGTRSGYTQSIVRLGGPDCALSGE